MTAPTDGDYSKLINDFASGNVTVAQLPLDEAGFWSALLDRVARRRARTVAAGREAAAEGLLHRPLKGRELQARNNAVVDALGSDSRAVRRLAVALMHEYEAGRELVEAASRAAHDTDYEIRLDATRFLAKNASKQTLQPLLDVLANAPGANLQAKVDSRDSLRGSIAADALVEIGEAAVPGLTKLLSNPDTSVRWRAALCLKKIGTPETLAGLLKALHDDSPDVAWIGADGLLMLGPSVQISVLRSVLAQPVTGVTLRALRHYAEHSSPIRTFKPILDAGTGSSAALLAVETVLKTLEGKS